MPKEVKKGPTAIFISQEKSLQEQILLWSLGVKERPDEPMAFVLYGRGRMMGDVISMASVQEGQLHNLLLMIGADCECGLDRKWMLGSQIPMLWDEESRQQLQNEVGFDVDNPMILAEMSRILAKETKPELAGDIGFGPDVIDLNNAFEIGDRPVGGLENKKLWYLIWIGVGILILILVFGVWLYYRNINPHLST